MNKTDAIDTTSGFSQGIDITSNEEEIIKDVCKKTSFIALKNIWRSSYWGTNQIGASHWLGTYKNKKAVLKIQGAKPDISEITMIDEFSKQNRSKLVRPPTIYESILWDDKRGYEVIIAEYASGDKVITDGVLVTKADVETFFNYYKEYRNNCIPEKTWLSRPGKDTDWEGALNILISNSIKAYPNSNLRDKEDFELAKKSYRILSDIYKNKNLEFMHGHFSCKDLIFENQSSDQVILFSNLFWKWKYPFSDAVFAYHWFMYELQHVGNISPQEVESQRKIWLDEMHKIVGLENLKLLNAALLERSVAGFIIDSFLCDPKKPISKYLYESTKNETKRLILTLK